MITRRYHMEPNLKRSALEGSSPKRQRKKGKSYVVFENQYLTITNQQGSGSTEALALSRLSTASVREPIQQPTESDGDVTTVCCYEVSAENAPSAAKEMVAVAQLKGEVGEPISALTTELYEYYVNNKDPPPGPPDISQNVYHGPCQPTNVIFPTRSFGKDSRAFKQEWYLRYTWLEYSFEVDAAFCFACRFFAMPGQNARGSAFTTVGFRNWKRAMEGKSGLRQHDRSEFHQRCFERWMAFNQFNPQVQMVIAPATASPIPNTEVAVWKKPSATPLMWNKQGEPKKRVEDNCRFLKALIEAIRFGTSGNRPVTATDDFFVDQLSYFKNLLGLVAKVDEAVNKVYKTGVNETVLVELIGVMANEVKSDVCRNIREKRNFSLVFLECKDKNENAVLVFAVRFFQQDGIVEAFLGFQQLRATTEEEVVRYLVDTLREGGVELKNCIGQSYDDAPALSHYLPRLSEMISQQAPQALCYHSSYRNIDGVLSDAATKVHTFSFFLPLLKRVVAFFESCPLAKSLFEQAQLRYYPDDEPKTLTRLPDQEPSLHLTYACLSIKTCFTAVIEVLVEIGKNVALETRSVDARAILSMMNLDFLFCLVLAGKVFEEIYFLVDYLNDDEKEMSSIFELLNVANSTLIGIKTEATFRSLMAEVYSLAVARNKGCKTGRLTDIAPINSNPDSVQESSMRNRESVFNVYVDCVLSELNQRYNEETQSLIHALDAFNPRSVNFLKYSMMESIAEWYNSNEFDLENELKQLQRFLERQEEKGESPGSIEEMVKHLYPYQEAFYESFKLLQTVVTLSPETSGYHRSVFAKVKQFFKGVAADEELTESAFLVLENDRFQNLNLDTLTGHFRDKHNNRVYKFA